MTVILSYSIEDSTRGILLSVYGVNIAHGYIVCDGKEVPIKS